MDRLFILSAEYSCKLFKRIFAYANSVDPDQTAPRGAVWSRSTLFAKMTFLKSQADDKADDSCCDRQFKG